MGKLLTALLLSVAGFAQPFTLNDPAFVAATRPNAATVLVTSPSGWTRTLPFNIYRTGSGVSSTFTTDFNIASYAPSGKTYYVSNSGSDSNSGLDAAHPLASIATAVGKSDVVVVSIASGTYGYRVGGNQNVTKSVSFIPTGGRVYICSREDNALSWSKDSSPNQDVWKAARSSVNNVSDIKYLDGNGDPSWLTHAANESGVEATPGSWYTDGTTVYVRLQDDRNMPDNQVWVTFSGQFQVSGGVTFYAENIDFWNFVTGIAVSDTGVGTYPTAYFTNCTFKNITGNAFSALGGNFYMVNCTASKGTADAFNYHVNNNICQAVEIGCTGRDSGTAGDVSDNGSTIHQAENIVRINGVYERTQGRAIHDVDSGSKSWLLGCNANTSLSTYANYACGDGGSYTITMWLDTCTSSGSSYDIDASSSGATVYIKNFTGSASNKGTGTITSY